VAKTHETGIRILAIERMLASGQMIKAGEIQQKLAQEYEIYAKESTIRRDIYTLNMFIPIESRPGPGGGFQRVNVLARCKEEKYD
jgi:predicted DNA-binding transcriptional regulator YafY